MAVCFDNMQKLLLGCLHKANVEMVSQATYSAEKSGRVKQSLNV